MDKVISSFAIVTTITGVCNDGQIRSGQFDPHGQRQRPAMEAVEVIHLQVMRHLGSLPDSRCEDDVFDGDGDLLEGFFQSVPDGKITAAGAPGDIGFLCHVSIPQDNKFFRD